MMKTELKVKLSEMFPGFFEALEEANYKCTARENGTEINDKEYVTSLEGMPKAMFANKNCKDKMAKEGKLEDFKTAVIDFNKHGLRDIKEVDTKIIDLNRKPKQEESYKKIA